MLELSKGHHRSMREHVTATLRTAILSGELETGQRLTEAEIAKRLGTSRGPVREALRQLELEGFVDLLPYRATRVSTVTLLEVREVLVPIRALVETFALRQLFAKGDTALVEALRAIVVRMQAAAASENRDDVVELDLEFHRHLVQAMEYGHPKRIWSAITPVIYRVFFVGTTQATLEETVAGHVRLLEVIGQNDEAAAERLLKEHIDEMELRFADRGTDDRGSLGHPDPVGREAEPP